MRRSKDEIATMRKAGRVVAEMHARIRDASRASTTSRGTSRSMTTLMPRGDVISRRASAWGTVRGKPSSTKPRVRVSSRSRRSSTMPTMMSSGSSSPALMYSSALRPNSVPSRTAARSMSPVEMWGTT